MSRRTRKNIGLVGLGLIGDRVRDVLRRKGFQVFVWNRTPRPVPNFVGAPAELAEMCDFIQVFVSDDDALLYVVKQLSPALSARHIVIAHPTVAPHTMVGAAEIVERRGARFIEAPFTGSKEAAEKGELVYYAGGEEAALRDARPLLEATSKEILEMGEIGQATAIKVATNMVTAATVQATAEALALVQSTGVTPEKFASAMEQNASYSKTLAMKLPKMIARNFERHFSVQHMLKDMQIASRLGLAHHLELGVAAAARDRLLEQMQRGHGNEDYSAVARKYAPEARPEAEADLELFQRRSAEAAAQPESKPPQESKTEKTEAESFKEAGTPAESEIQPTSVPAQSESPIFQPQATVPSQLAATQPEREPVLAEEPVADRAPALQALETHMPAAPFLNPIDSGEPVMEPVEPAKVAIDPSTDFLAEPTQGVPEDEEHDARGFFSRLLRRANT